MEFQIDVEQNVASNWERDKIVPHGMGSSLTRTTQTY